MRSVLRNFVDGMLRSGCEFRILIAKQSLKRLIETESEWNSVDYFRKEGDSSFLLFYSFVTGLWLLTRGNNQEICSSDARWGRSFKGGGVFRVFQLGTLPWTKWPKSWSLCSRSSSHACQRRLRETDWICVHMKVKHPDREEANETWTNEKLTEKLSCSIQILPDKTIASPQQCNQLNSSNPQMVWKPFLSKGSDVTPAAVLQPGLIRTPL